AAICSASRRSRISSCTASSLFLLANLTDITNSERITHRNHISLREMCPICGGLTPRITICYTPRSVCFCILQTHAACAILVCVGRDDGQPAGGAQMKFATVFIGLMAANFLFQAFTGQQWGVAFE